MFGEGCFNSAEAEFSVWVAIGFLLCFISSEIFAPWIFPHLVPAYTRLPRPLLLEWNSRWNSTVHATFICISCIGLLAFCPNLWHDRLFSSNYASEMVMSISTGYMLYDAATMPMYMGGKELIMFYIHHGVTILGSTTIVTKGFGKFYALYKLLTELSTPFINLRWFLRQSGVSSKQPSVSLSTLCFGVLFIFVRWFGSIPFWIMFSRSVAEAHSPGRQALIDQYSWYAYVFAASLDVLNVLWGIVVIKLCVRSVKDLQAYQKNKQQLKSLQENNNGPIMTNVGSKCVSVGSVGNVI